MVEHLALSLQTLDLLIQLEDILRIVDPTLRQELPLDLLDLQLVCLLLNEVKSSV